MKIVSQQKNGRSPPPTFLFQIKSLSSHQQRIIEKHNEFAETLFQMQNFLEVHHQFQLKKQSPDTIGNINPFDSLELDFSTTEQGELTK